MKTCAMLLTLLLVPNLSAQHKDSAKQPQPSIELQKQEEEDNTKIKLALIAAAVTLIVLWKGKDASEAISFDKLILLLWKK